MRKMKDSGIEWIGEIPENWEVSKLKYFSLIKSGMFLSNTEYEIDGKYAVFGGNGINGYSDYKNIDEPSVIIGRVGALCGNIHLVAEPSWITDNALVVTIDDSMNIKYMYYLLDAYDLNREANKSAQPLITGTQVGNIAISLNTFDEQSRIVDYLETKCGKIDTVIKAKENTNEKLKEYRQSIIYEAVTKGLDKKVQMKDSGIEWIGEIPEGWETKKLKYTSKIDKDRLNGSTNPELTFNYIDIASVTDTGIIDETVEMEFRKSPSRARMVVKKGDIIVSTVRTYLKAIAYIELSDKYICSTGFCVISPKDIYSKFMYYICVSEYFIQAVVSQSVGVSYPAISSIGISNIELPIPKSLSEQHKIADYLDKKTSEIDSVIAANEKTIEKLKEYRQSVIYEAVTGKIEV